VRANAAAAGTRGSDGLLTFGEPWHTRDVDWVALAVMVAAVAVAAAVIAVAVRVGINFGRRPRAKSRARKAKGEYQPPDAPEGRYW